MEMTRCMLHEKDLPKRFWGKAANTIMCLQNRISTKVVKDPTPFEVWYGYKSSLKFVRVFGCLCFIYIPQVKHDKLDKKSEVGIFVGILEESKDADKMLWLMMHLSEEELSVIEKNKIWELVDRPLNRKII